MMWPYHFHAQSPLMKDLFYISVLLLAVLLQGSVTWVKVHAMLVFIIPWGKILQNQLHKRGL